MRRLALWIYGFLYKHQKAIYSRLNITEADELMQKVKSGDAKCFKVKLCVEGAITIDTTEFNNRKIRPCDIESEFKKYAKEQLQKKFKPEEIIDKAAQSFVDNNIIVCDMEFSSRPTDGIARNPLSDSSIPPEIRKILHDMKEALSN